MSGSDLQTLTTDQWECVFNLMAAFALSDGEVSEAEIVAFWYSLQTLCGEAGLEPSFSRGEVAAWLDVQAGSILSQLKSADRDVWLADQLHPLESHPKRGEIYRTLETIVLSDREVSAAELDKLGVAAALLDAMPSKKITRLHPIRA